MGVGESFTSLGRKCRGSRENITRYNRMQSIVRQCNNIFIFLEIPCFASCSRISIASPATPAKQTEQQDGRVSENYGKKEEKNMENNNNINLNWKCTVSFSCSCSCDGHGMNGKWWMEMKMAHYLLLLLFLLMVCQKVFLFFCKETRGWGSCLLSSSRFEGSAKPFSVYLLHSSNYLR